MDSLTLQYIIIGIIFCGALLFFGRTVLKNLGIIKNKKKSKGCDTNCGCS